MRLLFSLLGSLFLFTSLCGDDGIFNQVCNSCESYSPVFRAEIAPAYVHVDVLEGGNTVKRDHLYGARLDLTFPFPLYPCILIKPVVMGNYGNNHSELWSGTINLGYLFDYNDCISLVPVVGVCFTEFKTRVQYPQFRSIIIKEKFFSTTALVGGDVIYRINSCWRFVGSFYYGFSNAKTTYIDIPLTVKSNTGGPSFYGMIEKDINNWYSVNFGGGYNASFSEDKDGIRAWGLKLGLVRWF